MDNFIADLRRGDQLIYCRDAISMVMSGLPALYWVTETTRDDGRLELRLQAGTIEILRFRRAGPNQIAASLGSFITRPGTVSDAAWAPETAERLLSDLQGAASRNCSEQGQEILLALVRFRGGVLREIGRVRSAGLIKRVRARVAVPLRDIRRSNKRR
jgi:hypothetical protein